jgi:hypothetical protein
VNARDAAECVEPRMNARDITTNGIEPQMDVDERG